MQKGVKEVNGLGFIGFSAGKGVYNGSERLSFCTMGKTLGKMLGKTWMRAVPIGKLRAPDHPSRSSSSRNSPAAQDWDTALLQRKEVANATDDDACSAGDGTGYHLIVVWIAADTGDRSRQFDYLATAAIRATNRTRSSAVKIALQLGISKHPVQLCQ